MQHRLTQFLETLRQDPAVEAVTGFPVAARPEIWIGLHWSQYQYILQTD
jgi:hypothetical protein